MRAYNDDFDYETYNWDKVESEFDSMSFRVWLTFKGFDRDIATLAWITNKSVGQLRYMFNTPCYHKELEKLVEKANKQ